MIDNIAHCYWNHWSATLYRVSLVFIILSDFFHLFPPNVTSCLPTGLSFPIALVAYKHVCTWFEFVPCLSTYLSSFVFTVPSKHLCSHITSCQVVYAHLISGIFHLPCWPWPFLTCVVPVPCHFDQFLFDHVTDITFWIALDCSILFLPALIKL